MAQSPTLHEILTASSQYALSEVYTNIPGIILAVKDMGQMVVDVQPTINIRSQEGDENTPRPPILNVPLKMPVSNQGGLTYPVAPGQPVWLEFSMRGMEIWKRGNGSPEAPVDMRTFDPRDCCASPIYPFQSSPNQSSKRTLTHNPQDVVLVHNIGTGSEVEIRLKPNGDVFINSPTKVTVNCQDAEINAESSTSVNTESFSVNAGSVSFNSGSFVVGTGTYAISATDSATMTANLSQNGSFVLNGIAMESHRHPENDGGGPTDGPIN